MPELFIAIALVILGLTLIVMAIIVLNLQRGFDQLKADYDTLTTRLQRHNDDVAGLCSAAVAVDRRLATAESRLARLADDMTAKPQPTNIEAVGEDEAAQAPSYDQAIQMIRRGGDADALVKHCGLTHDEAMLLVRLHGRP
ncbi:MAG: DUF2802 domain-containing protein [Methylomonas sp.]|nr:DUF2802 domain-containing protein [Methylomonas sp.]PPD22409.1 MAG: hypothetical protein CTY23_02330 [Methylomonas sp.]PPD26180.1 MAG: hypothetical protein CTY22_05985 [Methylomonas sp.]PPD37897.1 MAG: hypothetical protein CTY21_05980 [Methylomonas sp.]PPD42099.1 MAG: hypothetical protein CTY17_02205 [Methylomonas sp.]